MIDASCGRKSSTLDIQTMSHGPNVAVDDERDRLEGQDPSSCWSILFYSHYIILIDT
jgi:hypothetical protein